jgi:transcriptional regulator with XRE-family HTH domain
MESTVKQRLVQFIKMMHLTQKAFEERCGMGNGYVNSIRKGIGPEKMQDIIRAFPELNREWLLFGEGNPLKTIPTISGDITVNGNGNTNIGQGNTYINDTGNNDDAPYIEVEEVERAPIISATLARAPQVDVLEAVSEKADELEKAPVGVFNAPVSVWYRVQDESLAPKYEVGDLLALWAYPKGEEDPIPGKMYGINTSTNGLIVRRLFPQEDGGYIAKAANREEFPDYRIKPGNVVQIYKIMLMVRF